MRQYIEKREGQLRRARKKGNRLPTLQALIANPKTKWKTITIGNWYGEKNRKIEIVSGKCVWYHVGKEAVPIRWVIIRDSHSKFETQAVFSTQPEATAKKIVEWFIKRWQVEVTFAEARRHLGIAHAETMVGQSDSENDSVFVADVFANYDDGARTNTDY